MLCCIYRAQAWSTQCSMVLETGCPTSSYLTGKAPAKSCNGHAVVWQWACSTPASSLSIYAICPCMNCVLTTLPESITWCGPGCPTSSILTGKMPGNFCSCQTTCLHTHQARRCNVPRLLHELGIDLVQAVSTLP